MSGAGRSTRWPAVVLVGPPGAEVAAVGVVLAARGYGPLVQTDALVEQQAGSSVSDLFLDEGEAAFRAREREAVMTALNEAGAVVVLGAGAVLDPATRTDLEQVRSAGVPVVYLEVSLADAVPRIGLNQPRPAGLNPRQLWSELMAAYEPLLTEVASVRVRTDAKSAEQVAHEVVALVGAPGQEER